MYRIAKAMFFCVLRFTKDAYNGIWPTILLNKSVHRFGIYMESPCQEFYTMQTSQDAFYIHYKALFLAKCNPQNSSPCSKDDIYRD